MFRLIPKMLGFVEGDVFHANRPIGAALAAVLGAVSLAGCGERSAFETGSVSEESLITAVNR